jgi:hypothetical protein
VFVLLATSGVCIVRKKENVRAWREILLSKEQGNRDIDGHNLRTVMPPECAPERRLPSDRGKIEEREVLREKFTYGFNFAYPWVFTGDGSS